MTGLVGSTAALPGGEYLEAELPPADEKNCSQVTRHIDQVSTSFKGVGYVTLSYGISI